MVRSILAILIGSSVYGFAAGSGDSLRMSTWSAAKFPLLIGLTCLICAVAYYVLSQFVTRSLRFGDVMRMSLRVFGDISVLLASLAPVTWFLARTGIKPDTNGPDLKEYPLFLGLNIAFIAVCGVLALARQGVRLLRNHHLTLRKSLAVLVAWVGISLFAGGQCAWYLRPFFGWPTIEDAPFMEGSHPDPRGATSFYEAVWHVLRDAPLPREYWRYRERPPSRRRDE